MKELLSDDVAVCPGVGEMCVGAVCLLVSSGGRRHRLLTDHSKKPCTGLKETVQTMVGSKPINPCRSLL
jgi:hypothetical protein